MQSNLARGDTPRASSVFNRFTQNLVRSAGDSIANFFLAIFLFRTLCLSSKFLFSVILLGVRRARAWVGLCTVHNSAALQTSTDRRKKLFLAGCNCGGLSSPK
jgi:hypothetical protein